MGWDGDLQHFVRFYFILLLKTHDEEISVLFSFFYDLARCNILFVPCTRTLPICKVSMSKFAHFFLVSSFSCKTASAAATAVHPLILRFLITSIRLFYAPRWMRTTTTTKDQSALQSTSPYIRYLHDVAWSASGGKLRKIIIIIKRFYDIFCQCRQRESL